MGTLLWNGVHFSITLSRKARRRKTMKTKTSEKWSESKIMSSQVLNYLFFSLMIKAFSVNTVLTITIILHIFCSTCKTILKTKLQFNQVNRMKMNEEAYWQTCQKCKMEGFTKLSISNIWIYLWNKQKPNYKSFKLIVSFDYNSVLDSWHPRSEMESNLLRENKI